MSSLFLIDFEKNHENVEKRSRRIEEKTFLSGQERFHNITTSYYRGAMGIMLVYDITNTKSFDNIAKWLRNIDEHANEVMNKSFISKDTLSCFISHK